MVRKINSGWQLWCIRTKRTNWQNKSNASKIPNVNMNTHIRIPAVIIWPEIQLLRPTSTVSEQLFISEYENSFERRVSALSSTWMFPYFRCNFHGETSAAFGNWAVYFRDFRGSRIHRLILRSHLSIRTALVCFSIDLTGGLIDIL